MPAVAETFSLGAPVEIGRIDKELKKLWAESEGVMTRASPIDPYLWSWVDYLIYDSHTWKDYKGQLDLVETARREADQRIVLCDLNWTRLDKIRAAVAQFFDPPAAHHHFSKIEKVAISHSR